MESPSPWAALCTSVQSTFTNLTWTTRQISLKHRRGPIIDKEDFNLVSKTKLLHEQKKLNGFVYVTLLNFSHILTPSSSYIYTVFLLYLH
jgi:hypothetical protein